MISSKNLGKLLINSLLGIVLVLVWLHFVNLRELSVGLSKVNPGYLLILGLLYLTSGTLRAIRLKILLKKYHLPIKELIPLNYLGQFLSFFIPIRAGEIAKSIYITSLIESKDSKMTFAKSLVWVFVDRFMDFLGIILIVAILIFKIPNNLPLGMQKAVTSLLCVFVILAVLLIFSNKFSKKLIILSSKLLIIPKLKKLYLKFALEIASEFSILYQSFGSFLLRVLLTLMAVTSDILSFYFAFQAVGIRVGLAKTFLGSSLNILAYLVPAAPGYVGSAEASGLAVFSAGLGMPTSLVSLAIVFMHIFNLLAIPLFGLISLYLIKFDLRLLWRKLKRA